jgi:hypothetical protein
MVKLGQTPINNAKFALRVVYHDVVRFDVTVHDSIGMAEIQTLEAGE